MATIKDAIGIIEEFAPLSLSADFDNCGLKIGDINAKLRGVLVTVDTNIDVVQEAKDKNCNLIIEHHPSIWGALKSIDNKIPLNKTLIEAAKSDIAIYSAHTNVDYAVGGLNDCVAELLGLDNVRVISDYSSARIGEFSGKITLRELAKRVAVILDDDNITTVGDLNREIKTAAVINGGGGHSEFLWEAYNAGADIFITGEVKHSVARLAKDLNYAIIQFGHYSSEVYFTKLIEKVLSDKLKDIRVEEAKTIGSPFNKRGEIWN